MQNTSTRRNDGYIVVETVGGFLLLTLLVIAILSLINIVVVQARIHYAITQAAETVSMYGYTLELTGAAGHMQKSAAKREKVEEEEGQMKHNIEEVIDGVQGLANWELTSENVNQVKNGGTKAFNQAKGWVDDAIDDPKATIQLIMNYGIGQLESEAFENLLLRPLVGHYLGNGSLSGDEFLKGFGVSSERGEGLEALSFSDFSMFDLSVTGANDSTILTSDGDVKIVVEYDVDYSFGILKPVGNKGLHITQEVKTKMWLGGKGEGY